MVALNEQVVAASEAPATIEVTKSVVDLQSTEQPVAAQATEEEFERAQRNFQQGKKFLVLNKFDEAVTNFDDACKVYSNRFGELNIECADLYFYYGKALLELARVENTVLGNALNGIPEDSAPAVNDSRYGNPDEVEEKERETISEQVVDAMCEGSDDKPVDGEQPVVEDRQATEKPASDVVPPVAVEEAPVVEPKPEETAPVAESAEVAPVTVEGGEEGGVVDGEEDDGEEVEGEDEGDDEDDEDNEDISNLQRSWEMFELAKLVYKNHSNETTSFKKRISECLLKLGEISIEQELYEQALVDIQESIRLQEEEPLHLRDERLLAETYYQLGLGQQFNNQFKFALESYQRSINILQLRADKLRQELEQADNKQLVQDEIAELEAILPEILTKLDECNEQDQQTVSLVKEVLSNKLNGASSVVENGAEVKDITSLVKSKRKLDSSDSVDVKKTKFEENGEAPVEGEHVEVDEQH